MKARVSPLASIMLGSICLLNGAYAQATRGNAQSDDWAVTGIRSGGYIAPDTLVFKNGRRISSEVHGVAVITTIPTKAVPILVLTGMGCGECDGTPEIFVQSAVYKPVRWPQRITYYMPGPNPPSDSGDTTIFRRTRVFVGRCLREMADGVAWFVSEKQSGTWRDRVHIVDVVSDTLRVRDIGTAAPPPSEAENRARAGSCKELAPS